MHIRQDVREVVLNGSPPSKIDNQCLIGRHASVAKIPNEKFALILQRSHDRRFHLGVGQELPHPRIRANLVNDFVGIQSKAMNTFT
ncbi:MAG: hypothetical protein EBX95_11370 [Acidimicrobiia bacterium]|nr:hypothetical protein [Acidimicrobiia bacterium]